MKNKVGKTQHNVSLSAYDFNAASLQSINTAVKYEDPNIKLSLIQKKELRSKRPVIPATKCERLAYYRAFTSTQAKTEIITAQQENINRFLWYYAFNVFFKSLPHGFVHYFLAAYVPEEHMFVSKMVPLCCGIKYLFIMVGFLEMISYVDLMVVMFHYTVYGIIAQNPWNRCSNQTYFDEKYQHTIRCYEIQEFAKMFINQSHTLNGPFYVHKNTGEYFQVSQIVYYREQIERFTKSWDISIFLVIWGFVQILQAHVWKRYFWKALHCSQWSINFVDLCTLGYLVIANLDLGPPTRRRTMTSLKWHVGEQSEFWATDLAMLAESITAPPVVHVLTARSNQEIDPSTDSTTMVISNALIYIFRGVLSVKVKLYCETLVHTEMPETQFNEKSWFYLWPMFWQEFYLGDIYSILYIVFSMLCESLILSTADQSILITRLGSIMLISMFFYQPPSTEASISFIVSLTPCSPAHLRQRATNETSVALDWCQSVCLAGIQVVTNLCITETVVYEWPKVKRWHVMAVSTIAGIIFHCFTTINTRAILWMYGKGIATLLEVLFLYLCYPLGRLVDDYTFHYGLPPTRLKILSLEFVPVYYLFKIYVMVNCLCQVMTTESVGEENKHYIWSWSLLLIPIVVGASITMFKYLVIYRMSWSHMIRPKPKWGPRDFSIRQLRKRFDSRYYIDSEVPRLLSRYLLSKKETKVYKVDVAYDHQRKAAVSKATKGSRVGFGEVLDEKKEKLS